MGDAMSRAARHAATIGAAATLALLPLGIVAANAGPGDASTLQLAQAGGPGAPPASQPGGNTGRETADLERQLKNTAPQGPHVDPPAHTLRRSRPPPDPPE